jgi:8-oxo-dGTP diphosphatase
MTLQDQNTTLLELKSHKKLIQEVKLNQAIALSVDCIILGFHNGNLQILVSKSDYEGYEGLPSLIGGLVSPEHDLETAAASILRTKTNLEAISLHQIKAYGEINRHPAGRVITVAYCALINIENTTINNKDLNLEWVPFHTLEKMAFDHKHIINDCLKWLQHEADTTPIAFDLLPEKFSLRSLQELYSAILLQDLDKRNFRKRIQSFGYLVDINEMEQNVPHRPGKLYKLNNNVATS